MSSRSNQIIQNHNVSDMKLVSNAENKEELAIRMRSSYFQESAVPKHLRKELCNSAPSLLELFDETIRSKGEHASIRKKMIEGNTIEVEGLSRQTLDTYILEAEKLGKRVEYIKTLTVKISD